MSACKILDLYETISEIMLSEKHGQIVRKQRSSIYTGEKCNLSRVDVAFDRLSASGVTSCRFEHHLKRKISRSGILRISGKKRVLRGRKNGTCRP